MFEFAPKSLDTDGNNWFGYYVIYASWLELHFILLRHFFFIQFWFQPFFLLSCRTFKWLNLHIYRKKTEVLKYREIKINFQITNRKKTIHSSYSLYDTISIFQLFIGIVSKSISSIIILKVSYWYRYRYRAYIDTV